MNDSLEIGFWRRRHPRVERVLELAERLAVGHDGDDLERELAAAVREVRMYDAGEWPWRSASYRVAERRSA
jgi:hypothetical protein